MKNTSISPIKILHLFIGIIGYFSAFSQELKTFSGSFRNGKMQDGVATYTYYEDEDTREYVKHGNFKYTFKGEGDYTGYNQTISGQFENGLRTGTWSYTITMNDFGSNNPYFTGSVTLVANYKKGYAHGNWKEIRSYKSREKVYLFGQYKWEPFGPMKTLTIDMNFDNGKIIGPVQINDEFSNFKASGQFNAESLAEGKWTINDTGWGKNKELIYQDHLLYEFIARNNQGEVEYGSTKYKDKMNLFLEAQNMSSDARIENGYKIDTICGASCAALNNIQSYFPKLFSVDYFLYEFIGGDLSFKEGFKGGCEINIIKMNYLPLSEIEGFKKYITSMEKGDSLDALFYLTSIDSNMVNPKDLNKIKKLSLTIDYREILRREKEKSKEYRTVLENVPVTLENLMREADKLVSYRTIKDSYGNNSYYNASNQLVYVKSNNGMYSFDWSKPWTIRSMEDVDFCFKSNPGLYSKATRSFTSAYIDFKNTFKNIENKPRKYYNPPTGRSNINLPEAKGDAYYLYNLFNNAFEQGNFTAAITELNQKKSKVEESLSLLKKESTNKELTIQLEEKNTQNKKKTLYQKSILVLNHFDSEYENSTETETALRVLTRKEEFLIKVIELYNLDTKELEKQLKDIETIDGILALLLNSK